MNTVTSAFLGFLFTATLFAVCFFTVVGIKLFLITIKTKLGTTTQVSQNAQTPKRKYSARKRPCKRYAKSIEINPDEIDRIFVRKSS